MATVLFIGTEDLKRNTIVSGSVDVDKFIHYIKIAQQIHITDYIGTDLYDRLQAGITANDLTAVELTLLNDYIQDALIHFAMAEYLPFSAFHVKNGGVFKHISETSSNAEKEEIDFLVQKERNFAQYYAKRLVDYLCTNSSSYPQYSTNTEDDISPSKNVNYSMGIYLNDIPTSEELRQYRDLER